MNEEFTSLTLGYLLGDLDPAARAGFEARIATNAREATEFAALSNSLGDFARSASPGVPLAADLREEMATAVLRRGPRPMRQRLRQWAWPLAAAILLGLNLAQWARSHRDDDAVAGTLGDPTASSPLADAKTHHGGLKRAPLSRAVASTVPAPNTSATNPWLRPAMMVSIAPPVATPAPNNAAIPTQQGSLELHNLPALPADQRLYLWAMRAGADAFEPVGEIPRQIYGASGSINYQLRPGVGAAARFEITVEALGGVPATPSPVVVATGP